MKAISCCTQFSQDDYSHTVRVAPLEFCCPPFFQCSWSVHHASATALAADSYTRGTLIWWEKRHVHLQIWQKLEGVV